MLDLDDGASRMRRSATIHPIGGARAMTAMPLAPDRDRVLEDVGEMVTQALAALRRLRLAAPEAGGEAGASPRIASSFELAQLVGDFLRIRDPERRRYCLAVLRGCVLADAEDGDGRA